MVKPNLIDRVISFFNPQTALKRRTARALMEVFDEQMNGERSYAGASFGPLTKSWKYNQLSARAEISQDIVVLRNRMRSLVRNDGYASGAIQSLANNIVGKGIRPSISSSNEALKKKVERPFLEWCDSVDCDLTKASNFYGQQQLIVKAMSESGEVLIVKRYTGKGKNMQLALQVLEVDYIVTWLTSTVVEGKPGVYIIQGVYYDSNDTVIGYEVFSEHPGDNLMVRQYKHSFVSADDAILIFRADRPGQSRGVPAAASVMLEHQMLWEYEIAEAQRKKIAACFTAFIKTLNPAEYGSPGKTQQHSSQIKYRNMQEEQLTPGAIQYLIPGEEVTLATPPTAEGYDEYSNARLRKMARGWGLSYEVFSGNLRGVNFSSGKMGFMEQQRGGESCQTLILIPKLCKRIWQWWLELEQLKGTVPLETGDLRVDWTPPRREMIDPVKETKALIDQLQAGLISLSEAIRAFGGDPFILLSAIAKDNALLDKLGLKLISDYRNIVNEAKQPQAAKDGV